ncbi:SURF1 family protein [Mobilicoccus massiliensis]|uniref:SURF1 family protein n=1 Tax=Mobilicoccus massiliensis TaxID=1522310 RepID=UPI00069403DD|nr:SURF1 family protein [Mobilicoccus massiliensis]
MIRTALRPKWLALLGLVAVVVVLFGWLGLWQLNVAQRKGQIEAVQKVQQAPEVAVDDILAPQTSLDGTQVGRAVRATGTYDPAHQVLVVDRRLGDRLGVWVLTPLVTDTTGARLAVVRGFVGQGDPIPAPPPGTVTVRGVLEPQEGPPEEPRLLPEGQVQSVDVASLVNEWSGDVYNGFVLASAEDPPARDAQLTHVPPPQVDLGGINWRNAAYALQWWIFAGFVVYIWWRMVRDDHELTLATALDAPESSEALEPPETPEASESSDAEHRTGA